MPEFLPSGNYYINQKFSEICLGCVPFTDEVCAIPSYMTIGSREFIIIHCGGGDYTIQIPDTVQSYVGISGKLGSSARPAKVSAESPPKDMWRIDEKKENSWVIHLSGFPWVHRPGNTPETSVFVCSGDGIDEELWHWEIIPTSSPPTRNPQAFPLTGRYTFFNKGTGSYLGHNATGDSQVSDVSTLPKGVKGQSFFIQQIDHFGNYHIQALDSETISIAVGEKGKLKDVYMSPVVWTLIPQASSGDVAYAINKLSDTVYPLKDSSRGGEYPNLNSLFWSANGKPAGQVTLDASPYTLEGRVPVLKNNVLWVIAPLRE